MNWIIKIAFSTLLLLSEITGFTQTDNVTSNLLDTLSSGSIIQFADSISIVCMKENSDSVYMKRIAQLPFSFSLTYNPMVQAYINLYTKKIKIKTETMLGLSSFYFPIFDDILETYNIPNELKYIAVIESGLNPRASSRARAVGLWQFMKGTGREHGLRIDSYVDQRCDPVAATHAAARYFKQLFSIYGDWLLAFAAYNCGPGRVNYAIHRSGGKQDFWEIYKYLPRDTRSYIPQFIGAAYAFIFFKEHNLFPIPSKFPEQTDTVIISKTTSFKQICKALNISIDMLHALNPQFKKDYIPINGRTTYNLRLPAEQKQKFEEMRESIYKSSLQSKYQVNEKQKIVASTQGKIIHKVISGESIWTISEDYNVTVNKIKEWNNLVGTKIMPGQKLVVHQ